MRPDLPLDRLDRLCDRITVGHVGSMKDQYIEDGIPFLRSKNIEPFRLNDSDLKFIGPAFNEKLKKSALRPGDVVVVRTGYPGTAAVIPHTMPIANCADLVVITPGPELDARYLAGVFNSPWGQARVGGRLVGVAQQHFNVTIAKELEIPHPPLPAQRKIAAVLAAYDELIENNLRRIEILEEMAQAIYREWFVNFRYPGHEHDTLKDSPLGPIPEAWEATTLEGISSFISRGVSPKYDDESTSLVINQRCIRNHLVTLDNARHHRSNVKPEKYVQSGDVLVNSTGVGTLGRVAQVYIDLDDCTVDSHVTIVRPGPAIRHEWFGRALLNLESHFEASGAGATGQTELRKTVIQQTELALPPSDLQERFTTVVRPMNHLAEILLSANLNLRATRDLLLPRLISGELDVSELDIDTSWLAA